MPATAVLSPAALHPAAVIAGDERLLWMIFSMPTAEQIARAIQTGEALPIGYREVAEGSEGQELWVRGWASLLWGWIGSEADSYTGFSGDDRRVQMWLFKGALVMIEFDYCPS